MAKNKPPAKFRRQQEAEPISSNLLYSFYIERSIGFRTFRCNFFMNPLAFRFNIWYNRYSQ
nr:MAG TPA: Pre-mRNA-splicing factor CWC2 scaffold, Torus domain, CCCH.4A [Caudoviricetes sp.]